jgi:glutamine amidotransferase
VPLTFERSFTDLGADNWVTVPTNSMLTIHNQCVSLNPILDEYYNDEPAHPRSSSYAVSKGLVSTAPAGTIPGGVGLTPATSVGVTPSATPLFRSSKDGMLKPKVEELHKRIAELQAGR